MTKKTISKLQIIILLISLNSKSYSQDSIFNSFSNDKYENLILPPIDTLFYSAEQNPRIQIYDFRYLEQKSNIKSEKNAWLNYIRFSTSYQYGYLGAESLVQGYLIPAYYQTAQNAQYIYHVGFSLSIPFDDVIDRGNKIKKQKHILEKIQCEQKITIEEQKITIIELYNKAIQYISLYKIKTEAKDFAQVLSKIGQKDFINGKTDLNTLSQIKHSESVAFSEFEMVRIELKIALMKLEIICNYKFPIIETL